MASNESNECVICMNDFDTTDRQIVALLCGHNFCLTCLVCLKASDSPVCPKCRQSFAEVQLPNSSGFVSISNAEKEENVVETNVIVESTYRFVGCEVHYEPFAFWSINNKEFYCIQCIVALDLKTCNLKLVPDAVPLIQNDLHTKARATIGILASDITEHRREREEAVRSLEKIQQFQKELQELNTNFTKFIREVDYHNFMRRDEIDSATKIEEQVKKIESADDIARMLDYKRALEELQISSQVPTKTRPATFLSEVACTYTKEVGQKFPFIKKLQKVPSIKELQKRKNKPKHRADGKLTKIDAFILRCIEIRRMLFTSLFKAIQQ